MLAERRRADDVREEDRDRAYLVARGVTGLRHDRAGPCLGGDDLCRGERLDGNGLRGADARILTEDRLLELLECGARIDAELVEKRVPGVPIDLERLRLTARSVEGEHQLAA